MDCRKAFTTSSKVASTRRSSLSSLALGWWVWCGSSISRGSGFSMTFAVFP